MTHTSHPEPRTSHPEPRTSHPESRTSKPHHQKTKYHLGQVFLKNDPPKRTKYVITELRYSPEKWDPYNKITIHIDGDLGRLSFQGSMSGPVQEIGFKKISTGETFVHTAEEIEQYTKDRHLIF